MHRTLRTFAAFFLVCAVFAPSAYIGFMPVHEARAQGTGYGESKYSPDKQEAGGRGGSMAAGGGKTVVSCGLAALFGKLLSGILGGLGSTVVANAAASAGIAVPSTETHPLIHEALSRTSMNTTGSLFKDCVLDGILWWIKEMIIDYITRDIIAWINNGFEGAPAFLTDPKSFFRGVMDDAFRTFLYSPEMDALLCKPFKVTVQMNLWLNYTSNHKNSRYNKLSCSLDEFFSQGIDLDVDINTNTQEKYDKLTREGSLDFENGGFGAVFKLFEDRNNVWGASVLAEREAMKRANVVLNSEGLLIKVGDGWFSQRCDANRDGEYNGNVCTPGRFIAEQVNAWTGSALENLTVADEVAEIINALFAALVREIFGYANGLLSFGGSDNDDWWDDASNETTIDPEENNDDFTKAHSSSTYATTTPPGGGGGGEGGGEGDTDNDGTNGTYQNMKEALLRDIDTYIAQGNPTTLASLRTLRTQVENVDVALPGAGAALQMLRRALESMVGGAGQIAKDDLLADINTALVLWQGTAIAMQLQTLLEKVQAASPDAALMATYRSEYETIVGGHTQALKGELIADIQRHIAAWQDTGIAFELQALLGKVNAVDVTAPNAAALLKQYREDLGDILASAGT